MKAKSSNKREAFALRTAAKLIRFPGGVKKFAEWLRNQGFLMSNNEPYQHYMDMGWMILEKIKLAKVSPSMIVATPRITIKGLERLEEIVFESFHKCPCTNQNLNNQSNHG